MKIRSCVGVLVSKGENHGVSWEASWEDNLLQWGCCRLFVCVGVTKREKFKRYKGGFTYLLTFVIGRYRGVCQE